MDHLVIGTAGHVDHGKTELVKALTGYDTDRLKEEKQRGMTIELGFAPFTIKGKDTNPSSFSIVDVPGHEKLIKTMVSGATGMDMALVIISADEGIMPQTIEHINILNILDVTNIIIVVTKIDLVDETWLQNVKDSIRKYLSQTNMVDVPICTVSSKLNLGIENLKKTILEYSKKVKKNRNQELFRMPIDRVFTIKGHGTVVTGTIISGKISKDSYIEILPNKIISKVRAIQVHGIEKEKAYASQRCAINLNKVDKASINRGDVIGMKDELSPTIIIDTLIYNLSEDYTIKHNQKVRINIGTTEVIGKIKMIQKDSLSKNEKANARIRLEKPIVTIYEDKFIIRLLSPVVTLGGGKVLSHKPIKLQKDKDKIVECLKLLQEGNKEEIILYLLENNPNIYTVDKIFRELYIERQAIYQALTRLIKNQLVMKLDNKHYISKKSLRVLENKIITTIGQYYEDNIYSITINKETLRTKLFNRWESTEFDILINIYDKNSIIEIIDDQIAINTKLRIDNIINNSKINELERLLLESKLQGINIAKCNDKDSQLSDKMDFLIQINKAVLINENIYIHETQYKRLNKIINNLFEQYNEITVQQVRDMLSIGRKQTIILLEYLDQRGITKRIDNHRILLKK